MSLVRRSVVVVVLWWAAWGMLHAGADCGRVVAVGDLHGGYSALIRILQETALIDEELRWTGGEACFVQLGDVVDRGARSRDVLDLLMGLQQQAPERVEVLLGNHEVLNLLGDLRYVAADEYAAYAADETADERAAALADFLRRNAADQASIDVLRQRFEREFPPGYFAHRRAFAPSGRYGSWLIERPVGVRIAGSIFVHGGLTVDVARLGLPVINERVRRETLAYLEVRARLEQAGWLDPLTPYADAFAAVHGRVRTPEGQQAAQVDGVAATVGQFIGQLQALGVDPEGPLWYRELALGDEATLWPQVLELLRVLEAERIVVAHTTAEDGRIRSRFGGRVFVIDTGAGPAYGGQVSALEIAADGTVHAVYPGSRELLAEPVLTDAQLEAALDAGRVVSMEEIGTGITRPKKVRLDYRGRVFKAAFKTVDIQRTGMTRFERSGTELNFSDNYRYERAAYVLDRELGLGMVPVAVLRTLDGQSGALIAWVEDAIDEAARRERALEPDDPLVLPRQQDAMRVFDALILNDDRNLANQLITEADWQLHLIDHSRSFRLEKKLPEAFERQLSSLPRELYEALLALEPRRLRERTKGLLSGAQIKALLARRDRIVDKVRADVAQYGADVVFHAAPQATAAD